MKHALIALSLLAAFAPNMALAELPYTNNFETGSNGESIFSNEAYNTTWSGAGVAIITNLDYSGDIATAYMIPPLGGDHSKVMAFADGALSNAVDGTGITLVGIDTMVQPTFTQELTTDSNLSNSQFAIAFTTNGYLAIYHGGYTNADEYGGGFTHFQKWTVIENGKSTPSGKWIRVTVTINYDALPGGYVMFKTAIDGVDQSDPTGCSSANIADTNGGAWFVVAKWSPGAILNNMVLNGIGMIDDLSITEGIPSGGVTASNQVPYGWMLAMGVTNEISDEAMAAAETDDSDLDGMLNWQEYIAGTHPTNEASKLMIISQVISNGIPRIRWLSSTAALAPYRVDSTTNLLGNNWTNEAYNISSDGSGTNELVLPQPVSSPSFYRVQIVQ